MRAAKRTPLLEALIVRPGDTLIVRIGDRNIPMDLVQSISDGLKRKLPDLADVVLLAADQIAVYRP